MTEQRRREAAEKLRSNLDAGVYRKKAIRQVCLEYEISRSTLYRYCKRFGIPTL